MLTTGWNTRDREYGCLAGLPPGAEYVDTVTSPHDNASYLVFSHASFPYPALGCAPMIIQPNFYYRERVAAEPAEGSDVAQGEESTPPSEEAQSPAPHPVPDEIETTIQTLNAQSLLTQLYQAKATDHVEHLMACIKLAHLTDASRDSILVVAHERHAWHDKCERRRAEQKDSPEPQ